MGRYRSASMGGTAKTQHRRSGRHGGLKITVALNRSGVALMRGMNDRFWPTGEDFGPRQTGPVIEVLRPSAMLSGVGGFGLDRCYYLRAFGRRGLYCSSRRRSRRRQRLMPGTGHECQSSSAGFPRPPCSISRTTHTSLPIALMRKMPTTLQEQMTTGSRPNRFSCSTSCFWSNPLL